MRSSLSPEAARRLLFSPPPRNGPLHLYLRVGNDLVTTRPYAFGPWSRLPTRGIRSSQAERVDASGSASLPRRWSCSSLSFNFSREDGGAELEQFLPRDISSRFPSLSSATLAARASPRACSQICSALQRAFVVPSPDADAPHLLPVSGLLVISASSWATTNHTNLQLVRTLSGYGARVCPRSVHSVFPSGTGRRFRLRISPKMVELLPPSSTSFS